jgi:hypothetical protein
MEINGIDLLHTIPEADVQTVVTGAIGRFWKDYVVEALEDSWICIYKDDRAKAAWDDDYSEEYASEMIGVIWSRKIPGWVEVTLVVENLDDELFGIVSEIQTEFLKIYRERHRK